MRETTIVTVVLALLTCGCSFQTAEEFVISPDFTPDQQATIIAAADEWCEVAGACVPVIVGETANVVVSSADRCVDEYGHTVGSTAWRPTVHLCTDLTDAQLEGASRHEIGHALFGPGHHDGSGVMATPWAGAQEITEDDLAWALR